MDNLDKKILSLLAVDGRMTVKDIAQHISLTSPAVSERIRRMEREGIIAGYTVVFGDVRRTHIDALISVSIPHDDRRKFLEMVKNLSNVRQCMHVTGSYSYIIKVSCVDMHELEHLINEFQMMGQTSTQIILSSPVENKLAIQD